MIEVTAPDGSVAEFPDTMDPAAITALMRKKFGGPAQAGGPAPTAGASGSWGEPGPSNEIGRATAQGVARSAADLAMTPFDLGAMALNAGSTAVDLGRRQIGYEPAGVRFPMPSDTVANLASKAGEMMGVRTMAPDKMSTAERIAYEGARFGAGGALGGLATRAIGAMPQVAEGISSVLRGVGGMVPVAGDVPVILGSTGRIDQLRAPGAVPRAGDQFFLPYAKQGQSTLTGFGGNGANIVGDALAGLGAGTTLGAAQALPEDYRGMGGGSVGALTDLALMGLGGAAGGGSASLARSGAGALGQRITEALSPSSIPYDPATGLAVRPRDERAVAAFLQGKATTGAPEGPIPPEYAGMTAPQIAASKIQQGTSDFQDMGAPIPSSGTLSGNPGLVGVDIAARIADRAPFIARDTAVRDYAANQVGGLRPPGANTDLPIEAITREAQDRLRNAEQASSAATTASEQQALAAEQEAMALRAEQARSAAELQQRDAAIRGERDALAQNMRGASQRREPASAALDTAVVENTLRPMNAEKKALFRAAEGTGLTTPGESLIPALRELRNREQSVLPGLEGTQISPALDRVMANLEEAYGLRPPREGASPAPSAPQSAAAPAPATSFEDRLREAQRALSERSGGVSSWPRFSQVRDMFPDLTREQFDAEAKRLLRERKITIEPVEDQKTLTPGDRAAGIPVGSSMGHQFTFLDNGASRGAAATDRQPLPPPSLAQAEGSAPGVPYDQINASRKALGDLSAQARAAGQYGLAENIDALRAAIGRETEALAATSPEIGAAVANYRGNYAPVWAQGPGDEAQRFRRDYNRDPTARSTTPPSATAGRFLQPGQPEKADALFRILDASTNPAEGRANARDYMVGDLAKTAGVVAASKSGEPLINMNAMRKWRDSWGSVLAQSPEARQAADDLIRSVQNSDDRGRAMAAEITAHKVQGEQQLGDAKLRAIQGKQQAEREQKAAEAALKGIQGDIRSGTTSLVYGKDPKKAVAAVMGSGNPPAAMRDIVARLGGKNSGTPGMLGWKRAVADSLYRRVMNVNPASVSEGVDTVSFFKLENEFKDNERLLSEVFSPEEMNAVRRAHKAIEPLQHLRSQATTGSPTAERGGMGMRMLEMFMRARFGGLEGGSKMKNIKLGLQMLGDPDAGARELLHRAMLDPEIAVHLLNKPIREVGSPAWNQALARLMRRVEVGRELTRPEGEDNVQPQQQ